MEVDDFSTLFLLRGRLRAISDVAVEKNILNCY